MVVQVGALSRHYRLALAVVLLFGLLIWLPFIATDFNTTSDVRAYLTWVRTIQAQGLTAVYSGAGVNYPPVLLYLFGSAAAAGARLGQFIPADMQNSLMVALVKLPSILADVLTAGLIAWALRRRAPALAILASGLYVFNPAVWYVSAHWGQTDSVYTLFLVACVVALERGAIPPAWLAYALALATKPQSIALAPLLVAWSWLKRGPRGLAGGLAVGIAVAAILLMPWLVSGDVSDLIRASIRPPDRLPLVDVSAYNLWYLLLLGRVQGLESTLHPLAWLPLSYQQIGVTLFGALALIVVFLTMRRNGALPLAAAALSLGLFMLATHMRERYMFPAVAFLLLGAAHLGIGGRGSGKNPCSRSPTPNLWWAYGLLSLTFLFNLVTVAPFTPALGINLVAAPIDSTKVLVLKGLSVLVAGVNLIVLAWLVADLAGPSYNFSSQGGEITP